MIAALYVATVLKRRKPGATNTELSDQGSFAKLVVAARNWGKPDMGILPKPAPLVKPLHRATKKGKNHGTLTEALSR